MNIELSPNWKELLALLNGHEVEYALVGRLALAFHGRPRYTKEMDLLVQIAPNNADKLIKVLELFGYAALVLNAKIF